MFKKDRIMKYSIKKFTVGIASVAIGSILFLGSNVQASDKVEENKTEIATTVNNAQPATAEVPTNKVEANKQQNTNGKNLTTNSNNTVEKKVEAVQPASTNNKAEGVQPASTNNKVEAIQKETPSNKEVKSNKKESTTASGLNVLDKRTTDSSNIKDLLTNIIKKNEEENAKQATNKVEVEAENVEKGVQIISKLTPEYAEAISKGYIALEGGKYDNLLYKNAVLNPDADDDGDGILNKDELYIYKKDGRTYLGYDVHPKLADTDGDGQNDKEDKDKLIWNISSRDMALLMNLVYEKDDQIKSILDPNTNVASLKKKEFQVP